MADPWEQDWSRPAQTPGASPWDKDWSGAGKPAPVAKQDGQMASGFKRSFEEVPGLAAGVAAYGADVLGATETRDALIEYAKRKNDEVAAGHANDAQSITDTWDGKTGWLDFLANSAGYVAGQALQSIATGGLGAVGARMLAKQGARELAEGVAAREIAAGATEQAAQAAVANALAASATKTATRGAIVGAGAHNFGMELGSIYPDAVEEAKGADNLDGGDKFRILAAASLAAGVDTAGEAIMASRFLKGSKASAPKVGPDGVISEGPGLLGRAAREIPAGMARESVTEGIQTGIEQWGAAKTIGDAESIKDIVDSMGVGAVGGALGGAAGARKARQIEQPAPEPVTAILAAPDIDTAIAATRAAIEEPTARERNAATADEIRQLAPELQSEAIGLLSTANGANTPGHVRRYAQNRLDEMLAPLRTIPVGEVIEDPAGTIPVPDTQELTSSEATSQILQPPDPAQIRAVGTRIPTGRATEIAPESIELGDQIPVGDVIEAGGDVPRPDGMPERRNTDGLALDFGTPQHFNAPHSVFQYVQTIAGLGTPASRAFVQDYKAGRISNDDVLNLLVPTRREPTANQRIEAAAAKAPKTEALKPGDLLTSDGKPYGVRVAAAVRAKKEGGTVVEVQGGWAVRPKESQGATVVGQLADETRQATRAFNDAGIQGVVGDEGSMPQPDEQDVPPVRGAGDQGVSRVGQELPGVPGGYGDKADSGAYAGQNRQRRELRAGQLPLGNGAAASRQQEDQRQSDSARADEDDNRMGQGTRPRAQLPQPTAGERNGLGNGSDNAVGEGRPEGGQALAGERRNEVDQRSRGDVGNQGKYVAEEDRQRGDRTGHSAQNSNDGTGPRWGADRVPREADDGRQMGQRTRDAEKSAQEPTGRGLDDGEGGNDAKTSVGRPATLPEKLKAKRAAKAGPAPLVVGVVRVDALPKRNGGGFQAVVRSSDGKTASGFGATQQEAINDAEKQVRARPPPAREPSPDKAEMRPYRRADGSVAYEAVPIIDTAPADERPMPDEADPLFKLKNLLRQLQNGLDGDTAPSGNLWFKEPKLRASTERSVKELQESIAAAESKDAASKPSATVAENAPVAANDPTLDDELNAALGHLGDVLGDVFGAKLNITGPQHSAGDLLPALSKVVELLVRKGFKSFGQAAGKAAQLMRSNPKTAPHVDAISPRQWKAAYNAIAEGTEGTDTEEALAALTADQVKVIVAAPEPATTPTLADKIKAKRQEAAPQAAPNEAAEEAAPQLEPEAKPVRNDALVELRKQLSVLKALRACLG